MASPENRGPGRTPVQLLRRWVVDYFNRHDATAAREFIAPDYTLRIGDTILSGRDEQWLPAVQQQLDLFPGLGMTVHQVLAGSDRVAAWFSEHGASSGAVGSGSPGVRTACWSGVAIYRSNGERLTGCVAQEDYTTRQRQLKSGVADAVEPPTAAPWDTQPLAPDAQAEGVVRRWLAQSWPLATAGVRCDDEHITGQSLQFEVRGCEFTELFSSGPEVAFHVQQTGRYRGGLAGVEASDADMLLHCNGILRVEGGAVRSGRVIRDRGALRVRLKAQRGG